MSGCLHALQKSSDEAEAKCREFEKGAEEVQRILSDALKGTVHAVFSSAVIPKRNLTIVVCPYRYVSLLSQFML